MRRRVTIAVVLVLVVPVVAGGLLWWRTAERTELQRAAAMAPHGAERLLWTDWAAVRERVGARLDGSSGSTELATFLDAGYEADLTSMSALVQSAPALQAKYGFSPASVDWELFSQSPQGAVVMLHLPESVDFGDVEERLTEIGYTRPASATGVWRGGKDLLGSIGSVLTPELQYVVLDEEDRLVLTSDTADYLASAVSDAADQVGAPEELRDVAQASGEPLSAAIYTGDYTCTELAMGRADASDQEQADALIEAAGKVNPVTGFAMSVQPGRHVRVVLSFENDDQARTNADSRAALATGPAVGQGGDFSDRFSVGSATADGRFLTMDLVTVDGAYVLSDLSSGPVLFATC